MASKLAAARIASWSGVRAVIAQRRPARRAGRRRRRRRRASARRSRPTTAGCRPASCGSRSPARVDGHDRGRRRRPPGAGRARRRRCCRPACVEVVGEFDEGDTVDVAGPRRRGVRPRHGRRRRRRRCGAIGRPAHRATCPADVRPRGHPPRRPGGAPGLTVRGQRPGHRRWSSRRRVVGARAAQPARAWGVGRRRSRPSSAAELATARPAPRRSRWPPRSRACWRRPTRSLSSATALALA